MKDIHSKWTTKQVPSRRDHHREHCHNINWRLGYRRVFIFSVKLLLLLAE